MVWTREGGLCDAIVPKESESAISRPAGLDETHFFRFFFFPDAATEPSSLIALATAGAM